MMHSIRTMRDCPKFENCSAPICPLDPNWRARIHRKGEPVCFYLLEYVKPGAKTRFQGCIAIQIFEVIQEHIEALCHRYAPLYKALERAKRTGSRMATSANTKNLSPRWAKHHDCHPSVVR